MPPLDNPRHEKFAQELAKGRTEGDAYRRAGYDVGSDGSAAAAASRALKNVKIRDRVRELQMRGANRAEVTVASLIEELESARKMAMENGQASAAVAAIREKAVLSGNRIERAESGRPGEFESMNADELRDYIRRESEKLSQGHIPAGED